MSNKYIIIAVCVCLIVALVFGYTSLKESFHFVENTIESVATVGKRIIKIFGVDFNDRVDLFIPNIDDADLGSYVNGNGEIIDVKSVIKSYFPEWLIQENDLVNVQIYPTFYSGKYVARIADYTKIFDFDHFDFELKDYTLYTDYVVYSSDRIIRTHVNIITTNRGTLDYEVYLLYDTSSQSIKYFVTFQSTNIGYCSSALNSRSEFTSENKTVRALNSSYIEELKPTGINMYLKSYEYDMISELQNTDVYISYSFEEFFN